MSVSDFATIYGKCKAAVEDIYGTKALTQEQSYQIAFWGIGGILILFSVIMLVKSRLQAKSNLFKYPKPRISVTKVVII